MAGVAERLSRVVPAAPPADYLVFDDKPFRLRLGLRAMGPAGWLERDGAFSADMAEKEQLFRDRHDAVVCALPGTEAAADEVLAEIVATTSSRAGTLRTGGVPAGTLRTGGVPAGLHPIDAAGRLVQEDLCLHVPGPDGRLILAAASVCFPLRWDLRSKMGRTVGQIHGPVPGYAEQLRDGVDRVLDRLRPEAGLWRCNWTVIDNPALHQSSGINRVSARPDVTVANVAERAWLRVERQTLRRFPVHQSVLFTIHTYQCPIGELAADVAVCARLAAAIRALPPESARYKSLPTLASPLLSWLDALV